MPQLTLTPAAHQAGSRGYRRVTMALYGAGLASSVGIRPLLWVGAVVLVGVGATCAQWLRREPAPI